MNTFSYPNLSFYGYIIVPSAVHSFTYGTSNCQNDKENLMMVI